MELRCSALPRTMDCPASTDTPEVYINQSSEEASLGTCSHDGMHEIVREDYDTYPVLTNIAKKHGLKDVDTFNYLTWSGFELWQRIKGSLQNVKCEVRISQPIFGDHILSGSADVSCEDMDCNPVILDWKSFDVGKDHRHQLMGYLHLKTVDEAEYRDAHWENAKLIIGCLQTGELDIIDVTWAEYIEWLHELEAAIEATHFNPGEACVYCPRQNDCEARTALVRATANDFAVDDQYFEQMLDSLDPVELALLKPRVDLLEKAVKKYKMTLRSNVKSQGSIDLGNGKEFRIAEEKRQTIDVLGALPILLSLYGFKHTDEVLDKLGSALKLSKTALLDVVCQDAPKGKKAERRRTLLSKLEEGRVLKTTIIEKLVLAKIQPKELENDAN